MACGAIFTFFLLCAILPMSRGRPRRSRGSIRFKNTCIDEAPVVPPPEQRTGCGVLTFMNQTQFGNNANSFGSLTATPIRNGGLNVRIRLRKLSKPNLVLTAWFIYSQPFDPKAPRIFRYGYIASPLAPTYAGFTSGLGKEPNEFRYTSRTSARLEVNLDFNPTFPNEGPLGFATFCTQKDIPRIQGSPWKQPKIAITGVPYPSDVFVPTGSQYLRRYDPETGFEKLDSRGRPVLVRSPNPAIAVAIAGHIDKTTHGIAPGIFAGDHFEVMSFVLNKRVGRTRRH